jgi:hypothetical protein
MHGKKNLINNYKPQEYLPKGFCRTFNRIIKTIWWIINIISKRNNVDGWNLALDTDLAPVETFHYKLMGPWNKAKSIRMVELLCNILAKCVPCSSRWNSPPTSVIRVRPQKITHRPFMRDLQPCWRTEEKNINQEYTKFSLPHKTQWYL